MAPSTIGTPIPLMSRRSFSLALVAAAPSAAQADPSPQFTSGERAIKIEWFPAANVGERGGLAPALLLLHGADGTTYADTYRLGADVLAGAGYHVAFPHYLDRTGDRRVAYGRLRQDYPVWRETVRDGLTWLARRPGVDARRMGIVGISLGAALAVSVAANDPRVRAVVDYSGPFPDELAGFSAPLPPTLVLHGEDDRVVPVSNARRLVRLLAESGTTHEAQFFPGQGHVFTGMARLEAAARASAFLDRHLKGS